MGGSVWNTALETAQEVFGDLIGNLLGWLIVLAILAVPALILYFVIRRKARGRGGALRFSFTRQLGPEAVQELLSDPRTQVKVLPPQVEVLTANDPQSQAKLEEVMKMLSPADQAKLRAAMSAAAPRPPKPPEPA